MYIYIDLSLSLSLSSYLYIIFGSLGPNRPRPKALSRDRSWRTSSQDAFPKSPK